MPVECAHRSRARRRRVATGRGNRRRVIEDAAVARAGAPRALGRRPCLLEGARSIERPRQRVVGEDVVASPGAVARQAQRLLWLKIALGQQSCKRRRLRRLVLPAVAFQALGLEPQLRRTCDVATTMKQVADLCGQFRCRCLREQRAIASQRTIDIAADGGDFACPASA